LVKYKIKMGEAFDNLFDEGTVNATSPTEINVFVRSNTLYYWKVISYDSNGNTSESALSNFYID